MARRAQKLTQFVWEGTDAKGRRVKGDDQAPSAAYIKATLRRQGIRQVKVKKKPKPLFTIGSSATPKDITIATRQLSTMISAGIPIAQSIDAIGRGQEKASMQDLLTSIRQEVESGTSLSSALSRYPKYFDRLYTSLVAAGEQSGTLDVLLEKVAAYKEKIEALKSKVKSAMVYPIAVLVVAMIVIALMLIFVIPQFEQLFRNFGGELPTLTQTIVDLSRWMQKNWWIFLGISIAVAVAVAYIYRRSYKVRYGLDRLILRIPVFGPLFRKAAIARFARTLSTMFGAGVPLVDALESVAQASGNRVYHNAIMEVRNEVSTGTSLEVSMARTSLFPTMVQQMVGTGEESGELELMLLKVAEFYEQEVDDAVAALSSLIEPLMIVSLGVIIGIMVVAMYLPIFKMAAVF